MSLEGFEGHRRSTEDGAAMRGAPAELMNARSGCTEAQRPYFVNGPKRLPELGTE
jgi:hypothetical protein